METNNNNITDNSCINSSDFEEMRSQLEIMRRKLSRRISSRTASSGGQ